MHPVVIRSNITCKDKLSYFSSHWSDHMTSMSNGWLTDMRLMGREGDAWNCVAVHKAVILPLCPLLAIVEKDVTKEDPTIIFPDHPLELIQAFVHLLYEGSAPTSDTVTVKNLLELMAGLGLNMPADRLLLDRVERKEIEIVGFKNCYGLEIIEVKHGFAPQVPASGHSSRRKSLEITPCPQNLNRSGQPPVKRRRLSKIVKNLEVKRKLRGKTLEKEGEEVPELDREVNDNEEKIGIYNVPIEVKLECEEYVEIEDAQPSKKRKWNRRESIDKPVQSCDLCEFKCRFKKDLQEHCKEVHTDAEKNDNNFICDKCPFKGSSFHSLKVHIGKRHTHGVPLCCDICGFCAVSKKDMYKHMAKSHKAAAPKPQTVKQEGVEKGFQDLSQTVDGFNNEENVDDLVEGETDHNAEGLERICFVSDGIDMDKQVGPDSNKNETNEQDGESAPEVTSCQEKLIDENKKVNESQIDEDNEESGTNLDDDEDAKGREIVSEQNKKENVTKESGELVGFKCGVTGCERVSRIKYTTATYALNRLKTHHAKVHTELEESQFQYVNLFKEDSKIETPKQVDENPLQILKKVKATHKKAGRRIVPVEVRIKKGIEGGDDEDINESVDIKEN